MSLKPAIIHVNRERRFNPPPKGITSLKVQAYCPERSSMSESTKIVLGVILATAVLAGWLAIATVF